MNQNASKNIRWQYCDNIEDIQSYKPLWKKCIPDLDNALCNSFEWITHWRNTFWQKNWSLHLFIAFDGDDCVLLAPFYIKKSTSFPFVNCLSIMGQGEEECFEISSEYQDIYVHGKHHYLLIDLAEKVKELKFDQFKFNSLLDNANILTLSSHIEHSQNHQVGIRYTYSTENTKAPVLSKNNKSKLNKCKNKLTALNAKYTWVDTEEYNNYWALMKNFHQKRWERLGKTGAFCHNKFSEFHNEFRKANKEQVKVAAVIVNNTPIAIHYYFSLNDTLYFYQSGWDEENYYKASPGFALHVWCMNNSSEKYYDFMMGSTHNSYKAKLGCNHNRKMYNVTLVRNQLKYFLTRLIQKLT